MPDRIGLSFPAALAATIPFLCAVLGAVIANFPVTFFGGIFPSPLLAFMPVYFWCLMRPDLMPPLAVLFAGAMEDLLSGGPMGVWALAFVAAFFIVDRERETFAGLSGWGAIMGFGTATVIAGFTAYLVATVTFDRLPPAMPLLLQIVVTLVLYVPALWLLNLLHHKLIGALRSDF